MTRKVNEKCLSPDRKSGTMKDGLLTDRQMEVLRYRKQGLTQQQIADIISTSKANVCTIEKSAMENIKRAKEKNHQNKAPYKINCNFHSGKPLKKLSSMLVI